MFKSQLYTWTLAVRLDSGGICAEIQAAGHCRPSLITGRLEPIDFFADICSFSSTTGPPQTWRGRRSCLRNYPTPQLADVAIMMLGRLVEEDDLSKKFSTISNRPCRRARLEAAPERWVPRGVE